MKAQYISVLLIILLPLIISCVDDNEYCLQFDNERFKIDTIKTAIDDKNGEISITPLSRSSSVDLKFSLDGSTFQTAGSFGNITPGNHDLIISNKYDCQISLQFFLGSNYTLLVENGNGSGHYTPGQKVTIIRNPVPRGKIFIGWYGDIQYLNNQFEDSTIINMPNHPILVTAKYEWVYYKLDLEGGTISGDYRYDTLLNIEANSPPPGEEFYYWSGDSQFLPDSTFNKISFRMPDHDISLKAIYGPKRFSLTVLNGLGTGKYVTNSIVKVISSEGRNFSHWEGDTRFISDSLLNETTVQMTENITIRAVFNDISFSGDVLPIININCQKCHPFFQNYETIEPEIDQMYINISQCYMPLGGPCLDPAKTDLIRQWINSGKINN